MVEETMSMQQQDAITGDFAIDLDRMIADKYAAFGLGSHSIGIERTNDASVTLVRTAPSNECRKHVTLVLFTKDNYPPAATINLKELLRKRGGNHSETVEPRSEAEWISLFEAYVSRAIRAERRNKAIIAHPGANERLPWTNTVHALTKQWVEEAGCNLHENGQAIYMNTLTAPEGIDIGEWYFIDGYAVCAGIQNERRDVKLFSNQTDRTVRLELQRTLPDSVVLGLSGRPLGELAQDGFLESHQDLMIMQARAITNKNGETVLSIVIEPREVPMAEAPEGFDTSWMTT